MLTIGINNFALANIEYDYFCFTSAVQDLLSPPLLFVPFSPHLSFLSCPEMKIVPSLPFIAHFAC